MTSSLKKYYLFIPLFGAATLQAMEEQKFIKQLPDQSSVKWFCLHNPKDQSCSAIEKILSCAFRAVRDPENFCHEKTYKHGEAKKNLVDRTEEAFNSANKRVCMLADDFHERVLKEIDIKRKELYKEFLPEEAETRLGENRVLFPRSWRAEIEKERIEEVNRVAGLFNKLAEEARKNRE